MTESENVLGGVVSQKFAPLQLLSEMIALVDALACSIKRA